MASMHTSVLDCKAKNVPVKPVQSVGCNKKFDPLPINRRSGNFQPCLWDNNFIQSLRSDYTGGNFNERANKLKEDVVMMLNNAVKPLDQLELINHLQRLGLAYKFDKEIERTLKNIYNDNTNDKWEEKDLHATALEFRLLRQHGYHVPAEAFKSFMDNGSFKECLREDVKGMLSLYEASYYSFKGESLMEEAWCFTNKILRELVGNVDPDLAMQVRHALQLPFHWRAPRLEARWYIDVYEKSNDMKAELLELAKLDFNILQGLHQEELKNVSRWWNKIGLGEKMSFARDRMVASFLWSLGGTFERQFGYCRENVTKALLLITVMDDIYDVYGTLDEVELFTDVIERWDVHAIKQLPNYMKICFLALYNFVNEIVYDILKEQNIDVLPDLKNKWVDSIKSYLVEARWYHSGYKPTLEEYLSNGWVSISCALIQTHACVCAANPIKKEALEFLTSYPHIMHLTSTIVRLYDDIASSTDELKRGDVPKSIQCYMFEIGVSEEVAREHMRDMMRKKWQEVNTCRVEDTPLTRSVAEIMLNLVRMAHSMYNEGDAFTDQDGVTKDRLYSLIVQPIPL